MKKLALASGAVLVFSGIAAMYLSQELRAQREQNTAAMAHVTTLESTHSNGSVVAQAGIDGTQAPALNSATAVQTALVSEAPAARDQGAGRKGSPERALLEQMLNSPAGREMQRTMMRQMLEEEFPDLAKDLNLGKETAEKLLDLLVKQQMVDAVDSMGERAIEAEMKALLGDSYPKWGEYQIAAAERQREGNMREARDRLRNAITAGGPPLTDAQFEYVNSAVTEEQKRINQESGAMTLQQQLQRLPETNRRLAEAAAAHLNPQQLDRYRGYLQQQQEMMGAMGAMGAFLEEDEDE